MVSLHAAAASFRARAHAQAEGDEARAEGLRRLYPEIARALQDLGATEVWAFGSLVHGDVHARSDVDIAVRGLDSATFAEALGVMSRLVPAEFDLVRLEAAPPGLVARIVAEARRL
jgi:predicted nucleotidyltransferase